MLPSSSRMSLVRTAWPRTSAQHFKHPLILRSRPVSILSVSQQAPIGPGLARSAARPCPSLQARANFDFNHRRYASFASPAQETNALQVTDPLLIYRAKVARGELEEDEEQLRALVELRRINRVLRDYVPPAHLLGILQQDTQSQTSAALASAIESRLRPGAREFQDQGPEGQQKIGELVKWLSESEGLAELGTPKGLLITGTPGTGKSMVMDIFYDSLPTKHKFRRHYHHLLLDLYKIIWEEAERRRVAVRQGVPRPTATPEIGTGAVWTRDPSAPNKASAWRRALRGMPFFRPDSLADEQGQEQLSYIPGPDGDVVKTTLPLHAAAHLFLKYGHILLFDEIQLVDVASAGLLRRTLEAYWRLGGVVVGTSNRIPKDLYASNVQRGQITQFLEILQERCPNHEMRRNRDFRREPFYREEWLKRHQSEDEGASQERLDIASITQPEGQSGQNSYFLRSEEPNYRSLIESVIAGRQASPTVLNVYGRKLHVPYSIPSSGDSPSVCRFTFTELCDSPLGPADYLTLASTYHTFILEHVPQMTLMQKNQARRMITFLDAVYEAGCRLIVLADAGPDDLFFPDAESASRHAARGPQAGPGDVNPQASLGSQVGVHEDAVDMSTKGARSPFLTPPPGQSYPEEEALARRKAGQRVDFSQDEFMTDSLIMAETLSEAMQDTEEGFRPNISTYSEDRPSRTADPAERKRKEVDDKVGFKHLAIFSGEDERFAYQRAVSRLFEMSHPDWMKRKGWRPFLSSEMESWAGSKRSAEESSAAAQSVGKAMVANELNEAQRHLDRAESIATRFVDPSGDFAEEASYESSSFPGRRLAQTKLEKEMEDWSAKQQAEAQARAQDHEDQERSKPSYEAPDFSPGPIGKKRSRNEGPPVLSEAHVWGVREDWGPKAGAWGKGSTVFSSQEEAASSSPSSSSPAAAGGSSTSRPRSQASSFETSANKERRRQFSTSGRAWARVTPIDHYVTLQVPRSASQAQIKSQFYKLSKELHPDVNPSEDAKKRFQEVSEAYATLGSANNRRAYDRQQSDRSFSSGGAYGDNVGGGGFGAYHYDMNDNANRRARATYAWDYQRRQKARSPPNYRGEGSSSQGDFGRQTHSSIFNNNSSNGGSSSSSAFETLAAQQRAREERNRARQTGAPLRANSMEEKMFEEDMSNPFVRFAQVMVMLYVVFKAGTFFIHHRDENRANRR